MEMCCSRFMQLIGGNLGLQLVLRKRKMKRLLSISTMRTKKVFLFFVSIMAFVEVTAQFSLPRIDIEAKLSQNIVPGNKGDVNSTYPLKALETSNLQLGAHWQITQ